MRWTKTLFVNFLVFAGALLVLEAGLRVAQPSRGIFKRNFAEEVHQKIAVSDGQYRWMKPDDDLGWVSDPKHIADFSLSATRKTTYQIDNHGFRNHFDLEKTDITGKKIMLIGDSFMFGLHLSESQTIAHKLEEDSGLQYTCYNISSPGWGIDQMYLAYKKYVQVIDPDIVVVMYIDNDILRNLHGRYGNNVKPRFSLENNELVPDNSSVGILERFCWTNQISNRLYTWYMEHHAIKLSKKLLEEIIRSENKVGRKPLFVHIASEQQVLKKNKALLPPEGYTAADKADYIEVTEVLQLLDRNTLKQMYLPHDTHFSERGATLVAELIMKELDSRPDPSIKP